MQSPDLFKLFFWTKRDILVVDFCRILKEPFWSLAPAAGWSLLSEIMKHGSLS